MDLSYLTDVTDVAIVTANYGRFDRSFQSQVQQDVLVDWFYIADEYPGVHTVDVPWRVLVAPAPEREDPRLSAKTPKMTPWDVVPGAYRYYIWIDASMQITNPSFARQAIACLGDGVAVWDHPRRDCVYLEAEASVGAESQGKYDADRLSAQVAFYRSEGLPEHGGLYACGTVAWDAAQRGARDLGRAWLAENRRWSIQDQLSFPFVCHQLGVHPGVFPFPQMDGWDPRNPWLTIHAHAR